MISKYKSIYKNLFLVLFLFLINFIFVCKAEELSNQLNSLSKNEASLGFSLDIDCNRIIENKKKVFGIFYCVIACD
jgi:hypothetical protein